MRKITVLSIAVLFFMVVPAMAKTTATVSPIARRGAFLTCTITVTADASGGAVTNEEIDLSALYSNSRGESYYLYFGEEIPGTSSSQPDAHTVSIADGDTALESGNILDAATGATTTKAWFDMASEVPNYWPAKGNLYISLTDIGASHSTVIVLTFCPN